METIARDCELHPRWVQRCLLALEGKGLLRVEYGIGRGHPNRYVLPVDETVAATPPIPEEERVAVWRRKGGRPCRKGWPPRHPNLYGTRKRTKGGYAPLNPPGASSGLPAGS